MKSSLERLAALSPEEKRALLASLGKTRACAPSAELAHRAFTLQARRTPDAVAVTSEGKSLTYRQLDSASDRVANYLLTFRVKPEVLVGLCVERSPSMIVGLLGILKAGGAYVPIDPAYPERRIAHMIEDSGLTILLTEQALRESIPANDAHLVCLDSEWEGWDDTPSNLPEVRVSPENLAYVIYTSGSSGTPKGVAVSHAALGQFLVAMQELLVLDSNDSLLAVTTLSFDIAALELLLPLCVGARVEIAPRALATDGLGLAERLGQDDVSVFQATPATWRMILDAGWRGHPGLTMLCGGEALPPSLAKRLIGKGRSLWNLYGPTETTIWSSAARIETQGEPITIGTAIAGTQLHVLDARMRPAPIGVSGELYVGGRGVARGYLSRPGATAERFVPDPFSKASGSRLYRTGDLARKRLDGTLECLGRVDHQVKIRGFRVELGEIEFALMRHPSVREAAVVARTDTTGENAVVGYVSLRPGEHAEVASLRRWLGQTLPDYMIPWTVVSLDTLPQTPNGKIDRNSLPDPEPVKATEQVYVPARGPIEEAIATIWSDVLGGLRVGVFDNFFDLGGHSLSATQVVARVRDTFGVEASLRDFLDDPTVVRLARSVEMEMAKEAGISLPPITKADRSRPLPASFAQHRLWFLDQLEPGSSSYNIPCAVRLSGTLDHTALTEAVAEVVRRHEALRTTFADRDGMPIQIIAKELVFPLPFVDLSSTPEPGRGETLSRWIADEACTPFDLSLGPLFRVRLLKTAEHEHVVVLTMHHSIADGWSIGILTSEVAELYAAFHDGLASPLPRLQFQYADFAAWQRESLDGQTLDRQLSYWRGRLAGLLSLELPTDRPRPPVMSHRGNERTVHLDKDLLDAARSLGRKYGATLYMTGLAAFEILLHRYSGQDAFAIGSPIAGRTRSEWEPLIGYFANTLAIRCDLSGDPSVKDALARMRSEALGAYAHQDVPFDHLVTAMEVSRDPSRSPLFQAMFVLQNAPMPIPSTEDLAIEFLDPVSGTAKFDLILFLTEVKDGAHATMEYASDLFDASTVDRMLGHYACILREMTTDPSQSVGAISMMSESERASMVSGGEDDWADFDADELAGLLADSMVERPGIDG